MSSPHRDYPLLPVVTSDEERSHGINGPSNKLSYFGHWIGQKVPYSVQYIAEKFPVRLLWSLVFGLLCGFVFPYGTLWLLGRPYIPIGDVSYLNDYGTFSYEWPIPVLPKESNIVTMDIYDLYPELSMANDLLIKFGTGFFHSEITVYDIVFRYGKKMPFDDEGNVAKALEEPPNREDGAPVSKMPYRGRIVIGPTLLDRHEVLALREERNTMRIFGYENHEILNNNCNDMTWWVASRLGFGDTFPLWIDHVPKFLGRLWANTEGPFLAFESSMKQQSFSDIWTDYWDGSLFQKFYKEHPLMLSTPEANARRAELTGRPPESAGYVPDEMQPKYSREEREAHGDIEELEEMLKKAPEPPGEENGDARDAAGLEEPARWIDQKKEKPLLT